MFGNELSRRFKRLEMQNEELKDSIEALKRRVSYLTEEKNKLEVKLDKHERILHNYKHGEITFQSNKCLADLNLFKKKEYTRIYKDGEEYVLDELYLHSPIFTQTEKENIILVADRYTQNDKFIIKDYTVDLYKETFVQTT